MTNGEGPGRGESHHDSSSIRVGRAIALVVVGVVLGVILLRSVGRTPAGSVASVATASTTTTAPPTTTTAAPRPPAQVKTLVANGTKTSGAGAKVSDTLRKAGYDVLAPTNTTATAASSAVLFLPGYASEAAAVASVLGIAPTTVMPVPTPSPVPNSQAANVVVVVGPDLAGTGASAPGASGASTTTTTPHTTTTARVPTSPVR